MRQPYTLLGISACLFLSVSANAKPAVELGIDRFLNDVPPWAAGKRLGVLTNDGATDGQGVPVADRFAKAKNVRLVAYFAPEHGLTVDRQGTIGDITRNGFPAYSLYGEHKAPEQARLAALDFLICDLPDIGARFYTYSSTMSLAMQAAKQAHKPFVVLDRPNPITGTAMEGPMLLPAFASFTGPHPIPVRHGMTMGELARLFNTAYGIGCDLRVIELKGWNRSMWHDETGLPWRNPSPAMRSVTSAALYPGMCFFEATNLDGRFGEQPFTAVCAPWLDAKAVAAAVTATHPAGVTLTAKTFEKGPGIALTVTDRNKLQPVKLAFEMLAAIQKRHPGVLTVEPKGFDRLAGTDQVRLRLLAGKPAAQFDPDPNPLAAFAKLRQASLLY